MRSGRKRKIMSKKWVRVLFDLHVEYREEGYVKDIILLELSRVGLPGTG